MQETTCESNQSAYAQWHKYVKSINDFLSALEKTGTPLYDFGAGILIAPLPDSKGKLEGVQLYIIGIEEATNAGNTGTTNAGLQEPINARS